MEYYIGGDIFDCVDGLSISLYAGNKGDDVKIENSFR